MKTPEFGDFDALLSRLTANEAGDPARTIFLVGSALVAPHEPGGKGVPSAADLVELLREEFADKPEDAEALEAQLLNSTETYQKAFSFLNIRRGKNAVNRLIRRAVSRAYLKPVPRNLGEETCKELEKDLNGWALTPGVEALGRIVTWAPEKFGSVVLTTNFDPLIEVAIRRAGGSCHRTVLHGDGSLKQTFLDDECRVVHSHGYWYGSDTLHTAYQLEQKRPWLASSLLEICRDSLLVVVGFGGWRDVFTLTLADVMGQPEAFPNVLWAFHEEDEVEIRKRYEPLLQTLQPGLARGRLDLFRGIDVHSLFPQVADRMRGARPLKANFAPDQAQDSLRQEYLARLQLDCNRTRFVDLGAMDSASSDPGRGRSISLDQVYVSLDTESTEACEKDQPALPPLSAVEAVWKAREGRVVLLGLPGSGKSTFLRVLALRLAKACISADFDLREALPGWGGEALLPIMVPLALLAHEVAQGVSPNRFRIESFLEKDVEERLELKGFASSLLWELDHPGALVLFDGLDEVTDSDLRIAVRRAIEAFAVRHPRSRIIVTCRTYSYSKSQWQLVGWPFHRLAPLTQPKINRFIDQWYREQQQVDLGRRVFYEAKSKLLQKALTPCDGRRLHEIANNPLLLTVMALVHTYRSELPDARAAVYRDAVDLLLVHWQDQRTKMRAEPISILNALGVPKAVLEMALQEAAYNSQLAGAAEATISGDELSHALYRYLKGDKVQVFLDYCEKTNGLLFLDSVEARGVSEPVKTYALPHRHFREYLAGLHLRQDRNLRETFRKLLASGEEWRGVIELLAEHVCYCDGRPVDVENIIYSLLEPESPSPGESYWRAAWLAGDLLSIARRFPITAPDVDLDDRVKRRLIHYLEISSVQPKERAAVARTLAAIGDPRPGVGNIRLSSGTELPDIKFVDIPGGILKMGASPHERWNTPASIKTKHEWPYKSEHGPENKPFPVEIRKFQLAAYPVTLEQFRLFKKEDGYKNQFYWTKTGWLWAQQRVSKGAPFAWESSDPSREANHPVNPVTWHEAVAFCRWITARFRKEGLLRRGEVIRLPTEAEWEWAARGPQGLRWPWGNQWVSNACNSWEAKIENSCAVGLFPYGVNWTREVWDLAGNVMEWCSTKWVEQYKTDWQERSSRDEWTLDYLEGKASRTLRGGYHVGEEIYTRVTRGACRFFYPPTVVNQTLGFSLRLLRAPEVRA